MSETILIVDDERMIANLAALWLQPAGYKILVACDGRSGLAAAASARPDLVLLDIRMPDLDGFEVNRELKSNPDLAPIPVIFLSAHAQEATKHAAAAQGAAFFLSKPFECHDLLAAVRATLQNTLTTSPPTAATAS